LFTLLRISESFNSIILDYPKSNVTIDFTANELKDTFYLRGADPGIVSVLTASDGYGNDSH
jgi:hypothetical protein